MILLNNYGLIMQVKSFFAGTEVLNNCVRERSRYFADLAK